MLERDFAKGSVSVHHTLVMRRN